MRASFLRVGAASAVVVIAFLVPPLASIVWNTGAGGDLVMPLTRPAYSGWPLVLLAPTVLALAVLARERWRAVAVGAACAAVPFAIALTDRPDVAGFTPNVLGPLVVAIWLASDHVGVSSAGRWITRAIAGSCLVAVAASRTVDDCSGSFCGLGRMWMVIVPLAVAGIALLIWLVWAPRFLVRVSLAAAPPRSADAV